MNNPFAMMGGMPGLAGLMGMGGAMGGISAGGEEGAGRAEVGEARGEGRRRCGRLVRNTKVTTSG